jgi:beta-lactamase superfamily II metal-dependent hydrolase
MFTLEALQANDGDCLLLHYGSDQDRNLILIDGGPRGIYKTILKKRLDELRGNGTLDLRMVMVSHVDLDHITGIIDLFKSLNELQAGGKEQPYRIRSLWHNAFEQMAGTNKAATESKVVSAAVGGSTPTLPGLDPKVKAVVASVKQGNDLRNYATKLGSVKLNGETKGELVRAPESGTKLIEIGSGLTFTVLGPREEQLKNLEAEWEKSKSKAKPKATPEAIAADYLNRTVPNLSSIVVLAEMKTGHGTPKRMLLTGDAGGDFILESLETGGLFKTGKFHVDLLKVQHHGSMHSVDQDFFAKVTADRYVISGDGKHGNPSLSTLTWLSAARKGEEYDAYLTNRKLKENLTPPLDEFLEKEAKSEPEHRYHFREENALSISVDA